MIFRKIMDSIITQYIYKSLELQWIQQVESYCKKIVFLPLDSIDGKSFAVLAGVFTTC